MSDQLHSYVYFYDDEGKLCGFGPGDEVPGWAAAQITNPRAWGREPEPETVRAQLKRAKSSGGGS